MTTDVDVASTLSVIFFKVVVEIVWLVVDTVGISVDMVVVVVVVVVGVVVEIVVVLVVDDLAVIGILGALVVVVTSSTRDEGSITLNFIWNPWILLLETSEDSVVTKLINILGPKQLSWESDIAYKPIK